MRPTYSQLLQRPEWFEFRDQFIQSRESSGESGAQCDDCGENTPSDSTLHVHHRKYIKGRLPWEYDFEEMRLLCPDCHERIHVVAEGFKQFIQTIPAHISYEAGDLLSELMKLQEDRFKVAFARAKNVVRSLRYEVAKNGTENGEK